MGFGLDQPDIGPKRFNKYYSDDVLIREAYTGDINYVVHNLRPENTEEIWSTRWDEPDAAGVEAFAGDLNRTAGAMTFCAVRRYVPVAIFGTVPVWPHVWVAYAIATSGFARVVPSVTKHIRGFIIPALLRAGAHRVEARALATHTTSHRWLTKALGARHEATLHGYGRNGEDFHVLVWNPDDVQPPKRP